MHGCSENACMGVPIIPIYIVILIVTTHMHAHTIYQVTKQLDCQEPYDISHIYDSQHKHHGFRENLCLMHVFYIHN